MKKLLGLLIITMLVLVGCAHTEAIDMEKSGHDSNETHVCTDACDHSADTMAKDHVCTEACDHSNDTMAKEHECTEACTAECKAAHMEKYGADHVCTEACAVECNAKSDHEKEGTECQDAGEQKG